MRLDQAYRQKLAGIPFGGQGFSGITGIMAAALASGGSVFVGRYPLAATGQLLVHWIHLHYVTLGSYTTPVTAGRHLAIQRGSGADPSGGTDIDVVRNRSAGAETLLTGKVATTGALTVTSITYETPVRARLLLAQAGNAGNDYDEIWAFDNTLILAPGQLFGIRAGQLFDAAGTWQLNVKGGASELP